MFISVARSDIKKRLFIKFYQENHSLISCEIFINIKIVVCESFFVLLLNQIYQSNWYSNYALLMKLSEKHAIVFNL